MNRYRIGGKVEEGERGGERGGAAEFCGSGGSDGGGGQNEKLR